MVASRDSTGSAVLSFTRVFTRQAGRARLAKSANQRAPTKERITIRLSREVVEQFRASGDGWQARVDAVLLDWLKNQSPVR
jgi:uncharacterized protein (DUF4415 family)